jgi:Methyltransferase domain
MALGSDIGNGGGPVSETAGPDFAAITERQQQVWSSGDFNVIAIDYVPALLERARLRAAAEGPAVEFRVADAQALPFPDGHFDAVFSVSGVMFAPGQERAAAELLRELLGAGISGLGARTAACSTASTCRRSRPGPEGEPVRQGRRGCTNARRTATVLPAANRAVIRTRRSG